MTTCRFEYRRRCEWNYDNPECYCVSLNDLCLHRLADRLYKVEEKEAEK